jgi:2-phosphoglycerate kinase
MHKPIILIAGGTGVGTSRIAAELANRIGIYAIISTDAIREILRSAIASGLNPTLHTSTYLAGQSENYEAKGPAIQKEKILRGFKTQAQAVEVGIQGLVNRSVKENSSVIIEGIHLLPKPYKGELAERVLQYFVDIPDEDVHRRRLQMRSHEAPERKLLTYLDNFQEIRWIQAYIRRKAKNCPGVVHINNQAALDDSVQNAVQAYFKRFD